MLEEIFTPGKEVQNFIQLSAHAECRFHKLPKVPDGEDHSSHQREEVHFAAALSPHGFMEAIPELVKKRFLEVCHALTLLQRAASEKQLKSKLISLMLPLVEASAFRKHSVLMKARANVSLRQICGWILEDKRVTSDPWEKKDDYNDYGMLLEISPDHLFMVDFLSLLHSGGAASTIV